MALIVSPNLTVDRTVPLPRLEPGEVMRSRRAVVTAGSKGVNVARVLHTLGAEARLVGFVPDGDRDLAARLLGREPLTLLGVPVGGELRVATIYLEDDGRATVVNEPGPDVDASAWEQLESTVREALAVGDDAVLVCSGSLPPGSPTDGYGRLTALAHEAGMEAVVDAARDVLAATLPYAPDLVTPNLAEAEAALGGDEVEAVDERGSDVTVRAERAATALLAAGARCAVVTAGAAGAAYARLDRVSWFPGVEVAVRNPIGAGDSFVGGFVRARELGADLPDAVVRGLGAATASCEQDRAGGIDEIRAGELSERIFEAAGATAVEGRP